MFLSFDTETSGLIDFQKPFADPCQPFIVSVSAILFDDDGTELHTVYAIIDPEGREIPAESTKVHKITTALAKKCGLPFDTVYLMIRHLADQADRIYAFNEGFDRSMFEIECYKRYGTNSVFEDQRAKIRCAMLHMAGLMKIPGQYGDYRWPKLTAAYEWYFGVSMAEGAHNALVDTRNMGYIMGDMHKNGTQPK